MTEAPASAQKRVLIVLSAAQVVGGIGVAVGFAIATLVAARLSGSDMIGGLAGTAAVLGAALLALPTARAANRGGRRTGLVFAYSCGSVGALAAVIAISIGSWPLLLAGLVLFGGGTAANLAARYSATDLSPPGRAARDLSWVVWATTIGSVTGPNLAAPAGEIGAVFGLPEDAAPFALSAIAFALAGLTIFAWLRPDPLVLARSRQPVSTTTGPRLSAWAVLRESPNSRRALTAIVVSHTAMVAVMSMTPVHLGHGGATLSIVGMVLSLHIAGMFMFSPLVGWLASRIGRIPVLILGLIQLIAAGLTAGTASNHSVAQLSVGLFLLGTGWSCGLVAGSALLTESVPLERRPTIQGLSDLLMNGGAALGGVLAGTIVQATSYAVLGAGVAVLTCLPLAWFLLGIRRTASA